MKRAILFGLAATSLVIAGCEKAPEGKTSPKSANQGELHKTNPRAPKIPGCQTLIEMGHFNSLNDLNVSDVSLEMAYANHVDTVATGETSLKVENKTLINSCWIHLVHFKDLPQELGKRQLILNILADGKASDATVNGIATKHTCWNDQPEVWKTEGDCAE